MGFQHPEQRVHMLRGIAAAAKSPRTPAHLRPHLARMAAAKMAAIKPPGQRNVVAPEGPVTFGSKRKPKDARVVAPEPIDPFYGG